MYHTNIGSHCNFASVKQVFNYVYSSCKPTPINEQGMAEWEVRSPRKMIPRLWACTTIKKCSNYMVCGQSPLQHMLLAHYRRWLQCRRPSVVRHSVLVCPVIITRKLSSINPQLLSSSWRRWLCWFSQRPLEDSPPPFWFQIQSYGQKRSGSFASLTLSYDLSTSNM